MQLILLLACFAFWPSNSQDLSYNPNNYYIGNNVDSNIFYEDLKCPQYWVQFQQSCYRFIKSPLKPYHDAKRICQVYFFCLSQICY